MTHFFSTTLKKMALVLACIFTLAPRFAFAADAQLNMSPTSKDVAPGSTFSVDIRVTSTEKTMNAVAATVSFPANLLQVDSFNKNGIIGLWVKEPSYSNASGTVSFEGVILNPGFNGVNGRVITINFRAIGAGKATVNFISSNIYAHDGRGTALDVSSNGMRLSIRTGAPLEHLPSGEIATGGDQNGKVQLPTPFVPKAVAVTSPTHPDPNIWYSQRNVRFEWVLPKGITDTTFLIDQNPDTQLSTESHGIVSSYSRTDIGSDGQWYFHIRLKNAGGWGETTHFPFKVDSTDPSQVGLSQLFEKKLGHTAKFSFAGIDDISGISHYLVSVDGFIEEKVVAEPDKFLTFTTPKLEPGQHTLRVKAFDNAGNYTNETIIFTVGGIGTWVRSLSMPTLLLGIIALVTILNSTFSVLVWSGIIHKPHRQKML